MRTSHWLLIVLCWTSCWTSEIEFLQAHLNELKIPFWYDQVSSSQLTKKKWSTWTTKVNILTFNVSNVLRRKCFILRAWMNKKQNTSSVNFIFVWWKIMKRKIHKTSHALKNIMKGKQSSNKKLLARISVVTSNTMGMRLAEEWEIKREEFRSNEPWTKEKSRESQHWRIIIIFYYKV